MAERKDWTEPFSNFPFKDLKRIFTGKKQGMPAGTKAPEKRETVSDEEMFQDAMKEVREIKKFRNMPVYTKRIFNPWKDTDAEKEAIRVLEEITEGERPINLPDTQEYVEWVNSDYPKDILRKLHEGRYSVQDTLDLHGAVIEEAEEQVEHFLNSSSRKHYRCVKIIHGRGLRSPRGPVLKEALLSWLTSRYRKNLIAFVTARQCDGGLGALYVLLR